MFIRRPSTQIGQRRPAERASLLHFRPTSLLATSFLFQPSSQLQLQSQLYPIIAGSLIASLENNVATSAAKVPPPFKEILHAFYEEDSLRDWPRTTAPPSKGTRGIRAFAASFNRCIQHTKIVGNHDSCLRPPVHSVIPTATADQSITSIIED
jgi:hypothetical protein